jgi:hypothetical protein
MIADISETGIGTPIMRQITGAGGARQLSAETKETGT